jgi:hypothetical protein
MWNRKRYPSPYPSPEAEDEEESFLDYMSMDNLSVALDESDPGIPLTQPVVEDIQETTTKSTQSQLETHAKIAPVTDVVPATQQTFSSNQFIPTTQDFAASTSSLSSAATPLTQLPYTLKMPTPEDTANVTMVLECPHCSAQLLSTTTLQVFDELTTEKQALVQ